MWRQRQHLTGTQQLRIIITNAKNIHDDQEPYSKNACERALENHGNYVARINAFWVNHLRSPSPGIPLRRESVKEFADFLWPPESTEAPAVLLELLEVQAPVTIPDIPSELQMISPEGYIHALLLACARDLPRNLDKWKIILKSVPCAFTKGEGWSLPGDVWIRAWNSRNKISQAYESLSRTAFQTCMEIMSVKSKIEAELARSLTAAELVQELKNRGLKKASSQDEMTVNLVTHGLLIAERMQGEGMMIPLRTLEEQYGTSSCLNKMGLLYALVSKQSNQQSVWVMQSLFHYVLTKLVSNEDVTKGYLLGDKNSASMISLWELKALVWDQMLGYMLAKAKLVDKDIIDIIVLRQVLASHEAYRARMLGGDVAWQGQLAQSSLEALAVVEAVVSEFVVF